MYRFRELSEVAKNQAIKSDEHSKGTHLNDPKHISHQRESCTHWI